MSVTKITPVNYRESHIWQQITEVCKDETTCEHLMSKVLHYIELHPLPEEEQVTLDTPLIEAFTWGDTDEGYGFWRETHYGFVPRVLKDVNRRILAEKNF